MPETHVDIDAQIEELLDRLDWWQLPPEFDDEITELLEELYVEGLNVEAARIEALRLGLDEPPFIALAWDLQDDRVRRLIDTHAAEAVRNVNNGTKHYLRQLIKFQYPQSDRPRCNSTARRWHTTSICVSVSSIGSTSL